MIVPIPADNDEWFSFRINLDGRVLNCTIYWCEETEIMLNKIIKQMSADAQNDPLVLPGNVYVRDYDPREYYQCNNPLTTDALYDEWLARHIDDLPISLRALTFPPDRKRAVMERSLLYCGLNRQVNELSEMNVWTFSIVDEGDTVTGVINPGALYERPGKWSMWVRCDTRTHIGRQELSLVSLEFI